MSRSTCLDTAARAYAEAVTDLLHQTPREAAEAAYDGTVPVDELTRRIERRQQCETQQQSA